MDIRIIDNQVEVACRPLDTKHILLINREKITTSVGTSFVPFSRIYYYIYHLENNTREEILKDVVKYEVAGFSYGERNCPYIYFFTVDFDQYPKGIFHLNRFDMNLGTCQVVYTFEDLLRDYVSKKQLQVFLLNSDYIVMQTSILKELPNGYSGYFTFEQKLIDLQTKKAYPLQDEFIVSQGLQDIIPVVNNVIAVKIGWSICDDDQFKNISGQIDAKEMICLYNTSQFISDCINGVSEGTREVIANTENPFTLSELKKQGKYLVFKKINFKNHTAQIIYYQYITKENTIVNCKPPKDNQATTGLILDQRPFVFRYTSKYLELLDVNSKEVVMRFSKEAKFVDMSEEFILLMKKKKSLFSSTPTFEVYRYPEFNMVLKLKAEQIKPVRLTKTDFALITYQSK